MRRVLPLVLSLLAVGADARLLPAPAAGPTTVVALRDGADPAGVAALRRWLVGRGCALARTPSPSPSMLRCDGVLLERVPRRLRPLVDDVIPIAEPPEIDVRIALGAARTSAGGAFFLTPAEFARVYGLDAAYARGLDGTGTTIGIVGLSAIDPAELATFRDAFALPPADFRQTSGLRVPGVLQVEAMLDVAWSGALAPRARVVLVPGVVVVDALAALVDDPSVDLISLSVAVCPTNRVGRQLVRQARRLFRKARRKKKTVLVASGDEGRRSCGRDAPDPFAASPNVTAVGGTTPLPVLDADGVALAWGDEIGWADADGASGGGLARGRRPRWARGYRGRPVPDVAYPAARLYPIFVGGTGLLVGGTSASAPAWAGTVALLVQDRGRRLGAVDKELYRLGRAQADGGPAVFHDVERTGQNPLGLAAGPGHDLATGWGTPDVAALLDAFGVR
jgi:subtilase family serine protease